MFSLGALLRSMYIDPSSPLAIEGVSVDTANQTQVRVKADAGGEGGVIWNSALSLLQGLYPPSPDYAETLANGTRVTASMNGYQAIPIESVEPQNDISLEGWTECKAFADATQSFYASDEFKQKAQETVAFLAALPPYLNGRNVTLENMWNIFDFMNVQSIHDAQFLQLLPDGFLARARDLANWHEYNIFSSSDKGIISNVAARTLTPSLLSSLNELATRDGPKIIYKALSYKPFISLFRMLNVSPTLPGFVNYASAVVLELRASRSGPMVQVKFKNGTEDNNFQTYTILNGTLPAGTTLKAIEQALNPYAVNTTSQWCMLCGNTQDRGCSEILAVSDAAGYGDRLISPTEAGFIGASLAILLILAIFGGLAFSGIVTVKIGNRPLRKKRSVSGHESNEAREKMTTGYEEK